MHTILGHFDLGIDFRPHFYFFLSCLEHISYITYKFPQMCLMLDQFLWGHSSRNCDIACFYNSNFSMTDFLLSELACSFISLLQGITMRWTITFFLYFTKKCKY